MNKYKQLGINYPIDGDPSLSKEDLDKIENMIAKENLLVRVIRH